MITDNEKKILKFLLAHFNSDYSINEIAKECSLAPNGAYEILKKFEKKGILIFKKIANIKSYKIDFDNIEAKKLLEIVLMPNYKESKISYRYDDLKPLEKVTNQPNKELPPFVYYYIRVTQKDGALAWGSPIWVDYILPSKIKPIITKVKKEKK